MYMYRIRFSGNWGLQPPRDLTIRFIILLLVCFDQGKLFFHKKCTGGVAMSPEVYVTAGIDVRIALF